MIYRNPDPSNNPPQMRGYFGIGCYGSSKAANVGAIFRTAHAFGASFVFTVNAQYQAKQTKMTDTSSAASNIPFYRFDDVDSMLLPHNVQIVSVELTDDAVDLPSFRHPHNAVYMFGPERGNVPDSILQMSQHVVKIPTKFCVNVSLAAALVMYDRLISLGRYKDRPVTPHGMALEHKKHVRGDVKFRNQMKEFSISPPDDINM